MKLFRHLLSLLHFLLQQSRSRDRERVSAGHSHMMLCQQREGLTLDTGPTELVYTKLWAGAEPSGR